MDERIPEVLTAITLLLIGLFLVLGRVINFIGMGGKISVVVINIFSWLIFIFGLATAFVLLKDAIKKKDED